MLFTIAADLLNSFAVDRPPLVLSTSRLHELFNANHVALFKSVLTSSSSFSSSAFHRSFEDFRAVHHHVAKTSILLSEVYCDEPVAILTNELLDDLNFLFSCQVFSPLVD